MKKTSIIILSFVLLSALMVACNMDATIGIYSEVAQSTPSTDVVLKGYLGCSNDGKYYYLADDGVYRTYLDEDEVVTDPALFKSDSEYRIISAYYSEADGLYILKEKNSLSEKFPTTLTHYSYNSTEDKFEKTADIAGNFKGLLTNGVTWDSSKIYYLAEGHTTAFDTTEGVTSIEILSAFRSEMTLTYGDKKSSYVFFSVDEKTGNSDAVRRYYVFKIGESAKVISKEITDATEKKRTYCGFQCLKDDTTFMLLYKDTSNNVSYAKKLTKDVGVVDFVTLKDNVKYSKSQNASFYDPVSNKVVVKCGSYFDEIDLDSKAITQKKQNYAANICTADITEFTRLFSTSNKFIVGTVGSLLYSIDMENPENNPIQCTKKEFFN